MRKFSQKFFLWFFSFCDSDLGWWSKIEFSAKSGQCPVGAFGDNFGLISVGLMSLGWMSVGLKSV